MNYFGKFLVQKGLLTAESLVELLLEQLNQLPSLAEIVFRKKWISSEQLLQVFEFQSKENLDFKNACKQMNLWSVEIEDHVIQEISQKKIPLGRLIVQKKLLSLDQMIALLDEYLSSSEQQSTIDSPPLPQAPPVSPLTPSLEVLPLPQESPMDQSPLEGSSELDPVLLEEFLNFLTLEKINEAHQRLSPLLNFQPPDSAGLEILQQFLVYLHSIRGLLRCLQLSHFEGLVASLEIGTMRCFENWKLGKNDFLEDLVRFSEQASKIFWNYREALRNKKMEKEWFSDSQNQLAVESLFLGLMEISKIPENG